MSGWDRDLSRLLSQDDERASQSLLFHRTWHRGAGTAEGVRRRRAARRHRRGGSAAIGVAGVCRTPRRSPHTTAAARGPDVGAISRAIRSGLRAVVAGRNRSSPPRRWRSSWCADGKRGDSLHATAQLGGGGEGIGAPSSLARSEGARGASAGLRARSQLDRAGAAFAPGRTTGHVAGAAAALHRLQLRAEREQGLAARAGAGVARPASQMTAASGGRFPGRSRGLVRRAWASMPWPSSQARKWPEPRPSSDSERPGQDAMARSDALDHAAIGSSATRAGEARAPSAMPEALSTMTSSPSSGAGFAGGSSR